MILVLLLLLFTLTTKSKICTGDQGDLYRSPSCYHIRSSHQSYFLQESWCSKWHPNGHLVSVHSSKEEDFLQSELENGVKYWTGLKMQGLQSYSCDWNYMSWSDGSDIDYKPSLHCSVTYDPKCIRMTINSWEDSICSESFPAVCKYTPQCSTNCNERGNCVSDEECTCLAPFLPPDCSKTMEDLPSCDGIKSINSTVCNGNGVCIAEDDCKCNDDYIGTFCETFDQAWYSFFEDQSIIIPVAITVSLLVIFVYGCCVLVDFITMIRNCKTVERGGHFFSFNWNRRQNRHGVWAESSEESDLSSDDDSYVGSSNSNYSSDFRRRVRRGGVNSSSSRRGGNSTDDEESRMAGDLRKKKIHTEEDEKENINVVEKFLEKEMIRDESRII